MFVFPVPEPPIINILYGWSGVYGQLRLCITLFSLVYSSKLIIYNMHYPAIFAVLIPSKVTWHSYLICCTYSLQSHVTQLSYLLYLFPSKLCDTIILFAVLIPSKFMWYNYLICIVTCQFCCIESLQSLILSSFYVHRDLSYFCWLSSSMIIWFLKFL